MRDTASSIQIGMRALFVVSAILVLCGFGAEAKSGILRLTVRDVKTGYPLQAKINIEGARTLSLETNDAGRVIVALDPGEYRIEVSAAAHTSAQTHFRVGQRANLPFTIFLDPEKPPDEELPGRLNADVRAGFTLLHGYTVDAYTGKPISGVKVRMDHANVETRSDSIGHFLLSVPTPVSKFPGGMGTDTLIFAKRGYSTEEFINFGVAGEEMGGVPYGMRKGSGLHKHDATHKLMKDASSREGPQTAN